MSERPQRNLALELVRVTEAAALAAAKYMGTGSKPGGVTAATQAMHLLLNTIEMEGVVVIGKGEKHTTSKLYHGELVGTGKPPAVDVAIEPVEGASLLALGRANALSVAALAERWSLWTPGPAQYMDKLVVDKRACEVIDITKSATDNLKNIASALNRALNELTVFVLDRPRHTKLIQEIRSTGARVSSHIDGDVAGALLAAMPGTGVDLLMGIGGATEAVISAVAIKALGGGMECRRAPQSEQEMLRVKAVLADEWDEVLTQDDLVRSEDAFFAATGITDGPLLEGVHYDRESGVTTHSMVMRVKTGTRRTIQAVHQFDKLMQISQVDYDKRKG
jgi:fructose-1,6-bisphosphatase II